MGRSSERGATRTGTVVQVQARYAEDGAMSKLLLTRKRRPRRFRSGARSSTNCWVTATWNPSPSARAAEFSALRFTILLSDRASHQDLAWLSG